MGNDILCQNEERQVNKQRPQGVETLQHANVDLKLKIRRRQQAKNCARNNRMNGKQVAGM